MSVFETIIIAIVEGLTEFLPVSSTGHMIIAQNLLGVESTDFVKAFTFIMENYRANPEKIKDFVCGNMRYIRGRMLGYIKKHIELFY